MFSISLQFHWNDERRKLQAIRFIVTGDGLWKPNHREDEPDIVLNWTQIVFYTSKQLTFLTMKPWFVILLCREIVNWVFDTNVKSRKNDRETVILVTAVVRGALYGTLHLVRELQN